MTESLSRSRTNAVDDPLPDSWLAPAAAAVLLLAVAVLHLEGFFRAPAGRQWPGFIGTYTNDYNNDYYGYLAWIRQARDGFLLFREQFTTEPHGRIFFHPLFWLAGAIPRATGLPLMAGWWIVQALCTLALPLALDRFIAESTSDRAVRWTAFAAAVTGSGIGWMWGDLDGVAWERRPIDLWMPESGVFQTLTTSFFPLSAALAIQLMAFVSGIRLAHRGWRRDAITLGLWATALLAVHPYDIASTGGVLAVFMLLFARSRWRSFLLAGAIAVPYAAYCLAVVFLDPVFSAHRGALQERPTLLATAAGFGIPLGVAAVAALAPGARALLDEFRFLAVWIVTGLILSQLPLGFERKLLWGLSVPLALLSASVIVSGLRRLTAGSPAQTGRQIRAAGLLAFVSLCAVGSVVQYHAQLRRMAAAGPEDAVLEEDLEACRWLESAVAPGEAIVAGTPIAAMIPGLTGRVVFAGHWAQTIDLPRKLEFIRLLFSPEPRPSLERISGVLARNGVGWAVLARSRAGERAADEALVVSRLGEIRFRNRFVTIWRLRSGPPVPWGAGDWTGMDRPGPTAPR